MSLVELVIDLLREEFSQILESGARTTLAHPTSDKSPALNGKANRPGARCTLIGRLLRPEVGGKIVFPGIIDRPGVLTQRNIALIIGVVRSSGDNESYAIFTGDGGISIVIGAAVGIGDIAQLAPAMQRVSLCLVGIEEIGRA